MFCDLVGSTPMSARFDPEDLREIVGAYHRCVADTVGRFGGFVAKYMGDGVLIYFGYPEAHEDDAERAARAGLAVIDAVGQLATQEPLNVRIGIATGLVAKGIEVETHAWPGEAVDALLSVASAYDADLIVLDGDPLTDIAALGRLRRVIARGRDYVPDSGRFDVSAPGTPFADPDHPVDLRLLLETTRRRQA